MTDSTVRMRYSDSGQGDWSNWDEEPLGEVGEYGKRVTFSRLGQHRALVCEFSCSSPRRRDVIKVVGRVTPST